MKKLKTIFSGILLATLIGGLMIPSSAASSEIDEYPIVSDSIYEQSSDLVPYSQTFENSSQPKIEGRRLCTHTIYTEVDRFYSEREGFETYIYQETIRRCECGLNYKRTVKLVGVY